MSQLVIEPSPHIRTPRTTQKIMLTVILALVPNLAAAVWLFGLRALILTVVCCTVCVLSEFIFQKITKRKSTISDLSAIVTGMLLAFNLPVTLPIYMAAIGSAVAIVIVKQFFGGIGQNFANPAITGRIVLMLSFTSYMTSWTKPLTGNELITTSTPLADSETGATLLDMFLGKTGGCLGETCALAILVGGIILIALKIIDAVTPVCFIGTVFVLSFISTGNIEQATASILSGGLFLGAFFMATDYATTPLTLKGKAVFAVGCGLITMLIRTFGSLPEGVSYSILIMNILTPYIDVICKPTPFGKKKPEKTAKGAAK